MNREYNFKEIEEKLLKEWEENDLLKQRKNLIRINFTFLRCSLTLQEEYIWGM